MASIIEYINTFRDKIIHIHWHDNHGQKDILNIVYQIRIFPEVFLFNRNVYK
jgi:sugar phosphate isomerase/epimerase